jgi:hypothetical protein
MALIGTVVEGTRKVAVVVTTTAAAAAAAATRKTGMTTGEEKEATKMDLYASWA